MSLVSSYFLHTYLHKLRTTKTNQLFPEDMEEGEREGQVHFTAGCELMVANLFSEGIPIVHEIQAECGGWQWDCE